MNKQKIIVIALAATIGLGAYFVSGASITDAIGIIADKEKAKAACVAIFSAE